MLFDIFKRFAAVIIRIRDPKTTALIFASGKYNSIKLFLLNRMGFDNKNL